jgi:addiction module HigA family antidote
MKKKTVSKAGWVPVHVERSDSYPGRILSRELAARGMSQMELARRMKRPVQVINGIVNNRRSITAETAIGLAKVIGMTPRFWMTLQVNYDLRRLGVRVVA